MCSLQDPLQAQTISFFFASVSYKLVQRHCNRRCGKKSQQINGTLVITNLQQSDAGNYICTATSASMFDVEAVTFLEMHSGGMIILKNVCVIIL